MLSSLGILFVLAALVGITHAYIQQLQAKRLLAVLSEIEVGVTDKASVVRLTKGLRGEWMESSNGEQEDLGFYFHNRGMYLLRLVPNTEFRAYITFKNGLVVRKHASEGVGDYVGGLPGIGCFAWMTETARGLGELGPVDNVTPDHDPNHVVYGGDRRDTTIWDDNTYPREDRDRDWGTLDLSCFTRFGGCQDSRLLMPKAMPTSR